MVGNTTVCYLAKSPLLAKRRRWGLAMHVRRPSDARLSGRVDDSRRNHQTCDGVAAAMISPPGQDVDLHIGGAWAIDYFDLSSIYQKL